MASAALTASAEIGAAIRHVRDRITAACLRSGRTPDAVTLVAVSKTVPAATVAAALHAGQFSFGENYVQEAALKNAELSAESPDAGKAEWHLIGHLQRNKAAKAAALFHRVHTIDRLEVGEALGGRAVQAGRSIRALVQVNVSGETAKSGVSPEEAFGLCEAVARIDGLSLDGLMCIGRFDEEGVSEEVRREEFRLLRRLRDEVAGKLGHPLPHLSMGMSEDFELAVEEGATIVRVGSAIFGARPRH